MSRTRLALFITAALVLALAGTEVLRHTYHSAVNSGTPRPALAMAGLEVGTAADQVNQTPATPPAPASTTADSKKPINLGIPPGPYDPVLTQAPPYGRSLPPRNHRPNNPAGENVSIVQSEVTIATSGDTVLVGWNDGNGFVVPGETVSGYGYSTDRGETWVDGGSVPSGQNASVFGDPTVAVTNSGEWIFVSLDQGSPNGLAVNRSRFVNGTLTWNPSLKYVDQNQFLDKEFIEYDSAINRLYMTYVGPAGRLTYSTNDGATWAAPLTVANAGATNGFYPAPGVGGEVYVSWLNGLGSPNARLYCRYSSDSGQSWASSAVQVVQLGGQSANPPQCFNRSFNITFPSMSIDRSSGPHRGRAYFCYTDGGTGNFNTYLKYSDDKGQTWSNAIQLDDEQNTSEQFWPQIHVGPDGRVSVGWYDRRNATNNNSLCDFYITQSVDGGVTWGPNRRLSDTSVAWCGVPANIAPNFGDYIELTSDARSVFGIWSDARGGGPDVYVGRFDDRFLLAVTGNTGQTRTAYQGAGTAWYIPNETDFTSDPAPALGSPAELMVAALGLGTLATPPETNGIFNLGGEALHGELSMSSPQGVVNGTFSIARSGSNGLNFQYAATSSGLDQIQFLPNSRIQVTLVPAGPGQVNVFGTVRMNRLLGLLVFSLGGTIHFDGAPGGQLAANQSLDETVHTTIGSALEVHTRTTIVDGATVDVPPLFAGANPPPLATVRAKPNPLEASTRIAYTLTHPGDGSIQIYSVDGRSVRTIAKGHFEAGANEYPFDGKDDSGRKLALGGYFIRFETDKVKVAGKLFVVK